MDDIEKSVWQAGKSKRWDCYAMVARLRHERHHQVEAIADDELQKQVEEACRAADALAITSFEDVYRFVRLRYLPAFCWERTGADEMLVRVLTDTSVAADRRLDFIEAMAQRPRDSGSGIS